MNRLTLYQGYFLKRSDSLAVRTYYGLSTTSPFFRFDKALIQKLATATNDELGDASVDWDKMSWIGTGVNRFDLAGLLVELSELSNKAIMEFAAVYFVIVEE